MDLRLAQSGLEHLRSTLRHLVFRTEILSSAQLDASEENNVCTGCLNFFRNFHALTTLEKSLPLLFGEPKTTNKQRHVLAEVLPPNLAKLSITDDLWYVIMFVWTTTVSSMEVFKQFFTGETLDERSEYVTDDQQLVWLERGEGAWRNATPALREFVYDVRKSRHGSEYWCREGVRNELREAVESQRIQCRVLDE